MTTNVQQQTTQTNAPGLQALDAPGVGAGRPTLKGVIDRAVGRHVLRGLAAVSTAIDALPRAEAVTLGASSDGLTTEEQMAPWRTVRNAASKAPFYVSSDSYAVVNVQEALFPLVEAIQERGLEVAGSIGVERDGARIKGTLVIGNPEAFVEVKKGDLVLFGLDFEFRHDGSSAVRLAPSCLRLWCLNGSTISEELAPHFVLRHVGKPEEKVAAVAEWLGDMMSRIPSIADKFRQATEDVLTQEELVAAALGAGLRWRHAVAWAPNVAAYETTIEPAAPVSVWQGMNALTAYVNHTALGETEKAGGILENALGMVDPTTLAELVAKGRKVIADVNAARAEAAKAGHKRMPAAIPGITA